MTPATIFECEIAAEIPPSVVTRRTRLLRVLTKCSAAGGELTCRVCGGARSQLVTLSAGEAFSWTMIGVAERVAIRARIGWCGTIGLLLVANAARRDLASSGRFTRRRVTSVATVVGRQICRDRQRDAAIGGRVTAVATLLRSRGAGHVLRVIELHVEAFVESRREIFEWRIAALRVGVADQAHWNRRGRELSAMAVGAGFVTREAWRRRVVGAFVARVAGEGTVPLAGVQKFRVIDLGSLCCRRHGKKPAPRDLHR